MSAKSRANGAVSSKRSQRESIRGQRSRHNGPVANVTGGHPWCVATAGHELVTSFTVQGMDIHIGAAAQRSGLSIDAIRCYESLGLIEGARRDPGGRRMFSPDDVRWLVFLRAMRQTDMPIAEMQEYVRCRRAGAAGVDGMLAVLRRHRDMIEVHQARLTQCADMVEAKIAKYQELSVTGQPPGPPEVDLE